MKLDFNLNEEAFHALAWLSTMVIICMVTFAIWNYNVKVVKIYTANNYEKVTVLGNDSPVWQKVR